MRVTMLIMLTIPFALLSSHGVSKEKNGDKREEAIREKKPIKCYSSDIGGVFLKVCVPEVSIAGNEINCSIDLTNTSKTTYRFDQGFDMTDFTLSVKNSKGGVVPFTRYGGILKAWDRSGRVIQVVPGYGKSRAYNLTRFFDLSEADDYELTVSCPRMPVEGFVLSVKARFSVKD